MNPFEALLWLALNTYHEARSESQIDQIAVAHVVLNRVKQRDRSIKQVVLNDKQFSWTFQKSDYFPYEGQAFFVCLKSSLIALRGFDFTGGATCYHEKSIKPWWSKSKKLEYIATFGSHKFYREN